MPIPTVPVPDHWDATDHLILATSLGEGRGAIITSSGGVSADGLIRAFVRLLGFLRVGSELSTVIVAAVSSHGPTLGHFGTGDLKITLSQAKDLGKPKPPSDLSRDAS